MIKDPNCDNLKPKAYEIEEQVEECFKNFAARIERGEQKASNVDAIKKSINKSNSKIKKYYSLYAENESDNLFELIQEEESRVKELKKQLEAEKEREHKADGEMLKEIKKVSDIWEDLTNKEKNNALKKCIEKIVITKGDIDIRFVEF